MTDGPLRRAERAPDLQEALRAAFTGFQARLWTALPATVVSYNADKQTAELRPTIQGLQYFPDGRPPVWVPMPLLVDVPVIFPGGGGFTLTFPIAQGDEALVVFSSRCIDAWWQSGAGDSQDGQPQAELRMHNLSDGFAITQPRSQVRLLDPPPDLATAQLRSDDGMAVIEVAAGGIVNIIAPGGLTITGPVNITGAVVATGEGTFNGHTVGQHTHTDPQGGVVSPPTG